MRTLRRAAIASVALLAALSTGCTSANDGPGSDSSDITDVQHTDVERQSIGNCWLYAQASWVESMHLAATGTSFDISQSYWTYWHWYDEIRGSYGDELSTGGYQYISNEIAMKRGIIAELEFVPEDDSGEMSTRQETALDQINYELSEGRLADPDSRYDRQLVRTVLDEAWQLSPEVVAMLDQVFGEDGSATLSGNPNAAESTPIVSAQQFEVQYTERVAGEAQQRATTLDQAINDWREVDYPGGYWYSGDDSQLASDRREFMIRVQRALHDRQPVVTTWLVDFNAMENDEGELEGSFNMTTLGDAGIAGRQGGHMTVLEDYEAVTEEFGLLEAGVTLDPNDATDQAKLEAALLPSTQISFLRIKNSWGSLRPDRAFSPGFPGYHDLYQDYLDGPIAWCPSVDEKTEENCTGEQTPFQSVMLPPGY
jgi:hypothetical protein